MMRKMGDGNADPLYLAALAVEADERLTAEMTEWQEATIADGLGDVHAHDRRDDRHCPPGP